MNHCKICGKTMSYDGEICAVCEATPLLRKVGCRLCVEEKGVEAAQIPISEAKIVGHWYLCEFHYRKLLGE
ncbi:MAG: hypothetical protein QXE57_05030 [Nitrososphaerales archaeon]